MIRILTNQPALIINKKEKTLVIADLHLGVECELGIESLVEKIVDENIERIKRIVEKTKAKRLVILGDIKHKIPLKGMKEIEKRIVSKIRPAIEKLMEICEVVLIAGNHDGGLKLKMKKEEIIEDIALVHGHAWPSKEAMECNHMIVAHTHPAHIFKDKFGHRSTKKVWVFGKFSEEIYKKYPTANKKMKVIIMPAFNHYISGGESLIGPLFKRFKMESIHLLSGVCIN